MPRFMLEGPRRVQSFVLHLNTMHELYTHWLVPQSEVKSCCIVCTVKSERKHTTNLSES